MPKRLGAGLYYRRQPGDGLPPIRAVTVHHTTAPVEREPWALAQWMVTQNDPGRYPYPEIPYHLYIYLANGEYRCTWLLDLEAVSYHANGTPGYTVPDGTHVGQANVESIAIALAGDWSTKKPPDAMLEVLAQAHAWVEQQLGRSLKQWGHRDVFGANTRCPGDWWRQ